MPSPRALSRLTIAIIALITGLPLQATAQAGSGFLLLTRDIEPGTGSSSPVELTDVGGSLFFVASVGFPSRVWVSNGTEDGTVMLEGNPATSIVAENPFVLTDLDGTLMFAADGADRVSDPNRFFGRELWRSDGTAEGTIMVADIVSGFGGSFPSNLASSGGKLFFAANGANGAGNELWVSDGLPGGTTVMVKDINPGKTGSMGRIAIPVDVDGTLFFWADDGVHGFELWKSDGTAGGTVMVKDINATAPGASGAPLDLEPAVIIGSRKRHFYDPVVINGTLFFTANDGINGVELWRSDGTDMGTTMVSNINPGTGASSRPAWLTDMNGTLFFVAEEPVAGRELWKTDGFMTGTTRVANIRPGNLGSRIFASDDMMVAIGNTLYFSANDGINGAALWKSDGEAAGTSLVVDLSPDTGDFSGVAKLTNLNGQLFFAADDGTIGTELWQLNPAADGADGTDIDVGPGSAITLMTGPRGIDFVTSGNRLFLPAYDSAVFGDELWVTAQVVPEGLAATRTRPLGGTPPPAGIGADLKVSAFPLPFLFLPVPSGGLFAIVYKVTNLGPALAVDVVLTDILPNGVAPGTASPDCAFIAFFFQTLSCQLGNLAVGASVNVFADMNAPTVSVPTFLTDAITVFSSSVDPNLANNSWITSILVEPLPPPTPGSADLAILKLDALDPVLAGTSINYELVVLNNGPATATSVVVTDPLPAGLLFDSVTSDPPGGCNEVGGTVTCAIASLQKDGVARIQIRGNVPAAAAVFSNTATVAGAQPDPDLSNNSATALTQVSLPEPGSSLLAATALATLAVAARRRRRRCHEVTGALS